MWHIINRCMTEIFLLLLKYLVILSTEFSTNIDKVVSNDTQFLLHSVTILKAMFLSFDNDDLDL